MGGEAVGGIQGTCQATELSLFFLSHARPQQEAADADPNADPNGPAPIHKKYKSQVRACMHEGRVLGWMRVCICANYASTNHPLAHIALTCQVELGPGGALAARMMKQVNSECHRSYVQHEVCV